MSDERRGGEFSGRRKAAWIVGAVACAGLVLWSSTRVWAIEITVRPSPLPALRTELTGGEAAPVVTALSLVGIAGALALLALGRWGRVVVGVLQVIGGLLICQGIGAVAFSSTREVDRPWWPVFCAVGGAGLVVFGLRCLSPPAMRRDRRAKAAGTAKAAEAAEAALTSDAQWWDALDRGEDPSADTARRRSGDGR